MKNFHPKSAMTRQGLTLAWEIAIVVLIKIILLWLVWHWFFSAPKAKHMQVPEPLVTQHLLSDNLNKSPSPKSISTPASIP